MRKTPRSKTRKRNRLARPAPPRPRRGVRDSPDVTLAGSLLLRGTPSTLRRELLRGCLQRDLTTGESLLSPAQSNATLYLLLRGQMQVLLGESRETAIPILPGECVGEMSIIDGSRVSAPVVAAEPSTLLAIMAQRVRMTNTALTIRIRAHEREELLARMDTLTSAYNRRWLDENLPHYLERARSADSALILGLFDIDNFKQYNDTWGHIAGDDALRAVARSVREQIRPPDQLCRYGGEEFCLLLPDTAPAHAPKLAERALETISRVPIRSSEGVLWPSVTASLGFAVSQPDDTPESLLRRADRALYQAKHDGRNRFVLDVPAP